METVFPFGFPTATGFYLVLYVATFALHQAFMHYVLAGSLYVAWATLLPGTGDAPRAHQPLASMLRDWMPFALSATITAGIAPLLFVQIVYPLQFYTANLLLYWRWMVVIPVLIIAFYLLYLVKGEMLDRWPYAVRAALVVIIAASFLFVGFCWTANHLISSNEADWPQIYATGDLHLSTEAVGLRMLIWAGGACTTLAAAAGWQLTLHESLFGAESLHEEVRRLAWLALSGLVIAVVAAAVYLLRSHEAARAAVFGAFAGPYLAAAAVGAALQMGAWIMLLRQGSSRWLLALATAGCAATLLGASVVREAVHLTTLDITKLYGGHAHAAGMDGFAVFVGFAVVNTGVIAGCIWLVRRQLAQAPPTGDSPSAS